MLNLERDWPSDTETKGDRKSGGRTKPFDLEFLASVQFDTSYVPNSIVVSKRGLFCCRLCADLEPDTHVLCRSITREEPPWECAMRRHVGSKFDIAERPDPHIKTSALFLTVMNSLSPEEKTSVGINVS
jgi:hypothetical protein